MATKEPTFEELILRVEALEGEIVDYKQREKFQQEVKKKGAVNNYKMRLRKINVEEMDCLISSTVLRSGDGSILGYSKLINYEMEPALLGIVTDITKQKLVEEKLITREQDLETTNRDLEDLNAALRVLLKKRNDDKVELEEKVLSNVKELVLPFLQKLKGSGLDVRQEAHLDIVESNLNEIISPFLRKLSSKYLNFTHTEIKVASLVKEGKTTKEIAELEHSTTEAVDFHRKNIRKKLGILNKKVNLRTHLLSLTE